MKRYTMLLGVLLLCATAAQAQAQEKKAEEFNNVREFRNKIFEIHNRDPRDIYSAIRMLGSGFMGSALDFNRELRTITVRDFPENIATIEQAIRRLDQPEPKQPGIEMKISVLIGSQTPLPESKIPEELVPVVKQLESTLRYAHYGVMTSSVHRTKAGNGIEGSGVAEPTLLGTSVKEDRPILYNYTLRNVSIGTAAEKPAIDIERFAFSMRIPIDVGGSIQYQSVGFETPVSVRQNEKVVIGTTTMGSKALIVVVTARTD